MSNLSLDPLLTGTPDKAASLYLNVVSTTTTGAQVFAFPPGSRVHKLRFKILSLATETFACTISTDGTIYTGALGVGNLTNQTTGLSVTAATLGNGTYELTFPLPFQKIKFVKSAGVDTGVVAIGAILVPLV